MFYFAEKWSKSRYALHSIGIFETMFNSSRTTICLKCYAVHPITFRHLWNYYRVEYWHTKVAIIETWKILKTYNSSNLYSRQLKEQTINLNFLELLMYWIVRNCARIYNLLCSKRSKDMSHITKNIYLNVWIVKKQFQIRKKQKEIN